MLVDYEGGLVSPCIHNGGIGVQLISWEDFLTRSLAEALDNDGWQSL